MSRSEGSVVATYDRVRFVMSIRKLANAYAIVRADPAARGGITRRIDHNLGTVSFQHSFKNVN